VSRAPLGARGFDWTEEKLTQFERFLDNVEGDRLKLEFQGGEPTLRPDLLGRIIDLCESRFSETQFVICSNLTRLTPEIEEIYARDNVVVSTSIDGPLSVMTSNRTGADDVSRAVFDNFQHIVRTYGPDKVSALPTITDAIIDDPKALIDCYVEFGFRSIFLRPVNYQGFARKRYAELSREINRWSAFYNQALTYIAELNKSGYFEEFYLSLLVRSIFTGLPHGFVDFRSPAQFGSGYCVIDFDGKIYPTDEARMLSRTGQIDLGIGDLKSGIDPAKLKELNIHAIHQVNQDCQHCVYMPYCGIDLVDDISRYGRIDVPKHETWFCNRQMMLFDLIFEKIIARDKTWIDMFSKWAFHSEAPAPAYELFHD
jgi:His-Xaa-Ser system radical SAM maturase HxsB